VQGQAKGKRREGRQAQARFTARPAWKAAMRASISSRSVRPAGVVPARQAGDEGLEAVEAHLVEAAQLGDRLGMVVDAEVELAPVLVALDHERGGLLAALVAARRSPAARAASSRSASGRPGRHGRRRRWPRHLRPGKHVAGDAEVVVEEMAAPFDAASPVKATGLPRAGRMCSWR
jgi:hypothetical protein